MLARRIAAAVNFRRDCNAIATERIGCVMHAPASNGQRYGWDELADRVLRGETLSFDESLGILRAPDDELLALVSAAFRIRRRYFGVQVQLYYLKNARSGLCPEDCGYCSQSKISEAPIERYAWLNEAKLLEGARQAAAAKARTYCIVASGRGPSDREVEHVARAVEKIKHELGLHIC